MDNYHLALEQFKKRAMSYNADYYYQEYIVKCLQKKRTNRDLEETKVMKAINSILRSNNNMHQNLKPMKRLYRSRKFKIDRLGHGSFEQYVSEKDGKHEFYGYDSYDSKEPPLGNSGHERNSYKGASYLYLSEDPYTACAEIRPGFSDYISVASFVTKKELHVIDFSKEDPSIHDLIGDSNFNISKFITDIMFQFTMPVIPDNSLDSSQKEEYEKNSYFPSQYISDYIRKFGCDGICYRSFWGGGLCYTLFNCSDEIIEFEQSDVYLNRTPEYHIIKLNDGSELIPVDSFRDTVIPTPDSLHIIQTKTAKWIKKVSENGQNKNEKP